MGLVSFQQGLKGFDGGFDCLLVQRGGQSESLLKAWRRFLLREREEGDDVERAI